MNIDLAFANFIKFLGLKLNPREIIRKRFTQSEVTTFTTNRGYFMNLGLLGSNIIKLELQGGPYNTNQQLLVHFW